MKNVIQGLHSFSFGGGPNFEPYVFKNEGGGNLGGRIPIPQRTGGSGFLKILDPSLGVPRNLHVDRVVFEYKTASSFISYAGFLDDGTYWKTFVRSVKFIYYKFNDEANAYLVVGVNTVTTVTTRILNEAGTGWVTEVEVTGNDYDPPDYSTSSFEVDGPHYSQPVTTSDVEGVVNTKMDAAEVRSINNSLLVSPSAFEIMKVEIVRAYIEVSKGDPSPTQYEDHDVAYKGREVGDYLVSEQWAQPDSYRGLYDVVANQAAPVDESLGWKIFNGGDVVFRGNEQEGYNLIVANMWSANYKLMCLSETGGTARVTLTKHTDDYYGNDATISEDVEALIFSLDGAGQTSQKSFTTVVDFDSFGDDYNVDVSFSVRVEVDSPSGLTVEESAAAVDDLMILRQSNQDIGGDLYPNHGAFTQSSGGGEYRKMLVHDDKFTSHIPRGSIWSRLLESNGYVDASSDTALMIKLVDIGPASTGFLPVSGGDEERRSYAFYPDENLLETFLGAIS